MAGARSSISRLTDCSVDDAAIEIVDAEGAEAAPVRAERAPPPAANPAGSQANCVRIIHSGLLPDAGTPRRSWRMAICFFDIGSNSRSRRADRLHLVES